MGSSSQIRLSRRAFLAIFNEIENARYARMLQKLSGVKGNAPVRQLAGEVMAVLPIFNGAENRYLEGWNRFGQGLSLEWATTSGSLPPHA